jgi:hypothetical protein
MFYSLPYPRLFLVFGLMFFLYKTPRLVPIIRSQIIISGIHSRVRVFLNNRKSPGHVRGFFPISGRGLRLNLSTRAGFAEAIAAINRLITAGLERHLGAFTTGGAGGGKHLTRGSIAAVTVAFCLSGLAAFRAALGLIGVAFGTEELLVFSAEGKSCIAVGAGKGFILKTHWTTSSLKD